MDVRGRSRAIGIAPAIGVVAVDLAVVVVVSAVVAFLLWAPAILVVAVDLAVAVAVLAVVAVLLAGRGPFAFNLISVVDAVRAEGVVMLAPMIVAVAA